MAAQMFFALVVLLAAAAFAPAADAVAVAKKCQFGAWKNPAIIAPRYIYAGTTCTWIWADDLSHCVQGTSGPVRFASPVYAGKGTKWSFTFKKPGTYKFDCCLHLANMKGTVIVLAKPSTCKPVCNGRCWGPNKCGGNCRQYPKPGTVAACRKCCNAGGNTVAGSQACFKACRK